MAGVSYERLREHARYTVAGAAGYGFDVVVDDAANFITTIATPTGLSSLVIERIDNGLPAFVDVHSGGAYNVARNEMVLDILATSSWRSNYGGLWCRTAAPQLTTPQSGCLNFGWRVRLPSSIFNPSDMSEVFAFLFHLVDSFDEVCDYLATEVAPFGGGTRFKASSQDSAGALFGGMLPPPEATPLRPANAPVQPPPATSASESGQISYEHPSRTRDRPAPTTLRSVPAPIEPAQTPTSESRWRATPPAPGRLQLAPLEPLFFDAVLEAIRSWGGTETLRNVRVAIDNAIFSVGEQYFVHMNEPKNRKLFSRKFRDHDQYAAPSSDEMIDFVLTTDSNAEGIFVSLLDRQLQAWSQRP